MNRGIRYTAVLVGTLAAIAVSAPVHAEDDDMPMMQQGRSGKMMGGGMMGQDRGMGMMGPDMMSGGMMGPGGMGGGMMSGGMGMMGGGGMGMGMATMHALDLDRDQVRKMTQIHRELAQKHAGMRADMQELRWELSQELAKEQPSPKEVGNLYQQIFQKQRQLIQDRVEARNRMMDALSDKQRKQWRQMMENMQQMRMGGGMPMYDDDEE